MHVEADTVGRRVRGRNCLHGAGLCRQSRNVQVGTDGEAGDERIARQHHIVSRPLQVKRGVGQRTDPLRVADANSFSGGGQVGINALLIGHVTADTQQAAAAHGRQRLDLQPVLIEFERPV